MDKKNSEEIATGLDRLKKHVFYELLNLVGRVFIVVRYAEDVVIGNRGFLPEEKEQGIVLILNKRMDFTWSDWGIDAKLVFEKTPQHCLIPEEHIIGIYSPEINTQFLCLPATGESDTTEDTAEEPHQAKVVKADFRKKKR
jgi:hypothetical protein